MNFTAGPFRLTPDPGWTFQYHAFRAAFNAVTHEILTGGPVILVAGAAGVGKTTLLHTLVRRYESTASKVIFLPGAQVHSGDLMRLLASAAGLSTRYLDDFDETELERQLYAHLETCSVSQSSLLVIADDVDKLQPDAWETLLGLPMKLSSGKRVTLVAAGTLAFIDAARPQALRNNVLNCSQVTLDGLYELEMQSYFYSRLEHVGMEPVPILDPSAWKELYRSSRGLPRLINHIGARLLLRWPSDSRQYIDLAELRDVVEDLQADGILTSLSELEVAREVDESRLLHRRPSDAGKRGPDHSRRGIITLGVLLGSLAALLMAPYHFLPIVDDTGAPHLHSSDALVTVAPGTATVEETDSASGVVADADTQRLTTISAPSASAMAAAGDASVGAEPLGEMWPLASAEHALGDIDAEPYAGELPSSAVPASPEPDSQRVTVHVQPPRVSGSPPTDQRRESGKRQLAAPITVEENTKLREANREDAAHKRHRAEILVLLNEMNERLQRDHLRTPTGNSAWDRARSVLALDPSNPEALAARGRIVQRYLLLADDAFARGKLLLAETLLERAATLDGNSEEILRARARLALGAVEGAPAPRIEVAILPSQTSISCRWPVEEYLTKVAKRIVESEPDLKLAYFPSGDAAASSAGTAPRTWWTPDGQLRSGAPTVAEHREIMSAKVLISSWIDCPRNEAVYEPWREFKIAIYDMEKEKVYAKEGTLHDIEGPARALVDAYLNARLAASTAMAGS